MYVKKLSALVAVPFIAVSLSACGGNSNSSDETTAKETTTSQEAPSPEATTSSGTGSGGSDSGSADKPSRDDVKAKLKTLLEAQGLTQQLSQRGVSTEHIDSFYGCITDNAYDGLSAKTLQALVAGQNNASVISAEEQKKLMSATQTCAQQLRQEITGNAG